MVAKTRLMRLKTKPCYTFKVTRHRLSVNIMSWFIPSGEKCKSNKREKMEIGFLYSVYMTITSSRVYDANMTTDIDRQLLD